MIRSIDKWLPGYLASIRRRPRNVAGPKHLMFCVADHYEPFRAGEHGKPDAANARDGVAAWAERYPGSVDDFRDSDGKHPQHTFFYPQEEYDRACVEVLADLVSRGYGEVEIQLHHRNDTAEGFRSKLAEFRDVLRTKHRLLGSGRDGMPQYGFVHGNWSLCNARPDGDWCGVNEELGILAGTGCYADFTFPSAPSPTQPRMVNAIYRACDRKGRPRGADRGVRASVCEEGRISNNQHSRLRQGYGGQAIPNTPAFAKASTSAEATVDETAGKQGKTQCPSLKSQVSSEDRSETRHPESCISNAASGHSDTPTPRYSNTPLLLITGPLALDWRRRKWGILPKLENGEIAGGNWPTAERMDLWVKQHIHVQGRPDWVFVKVHTHGYVLSNREVLLGESMRRLHKHLSSEYNDGKDWFLHYVTAREMYNIVRAAEDGKTGDPGDFRDYEIVPPPCTRREA